MAYHFSLATLGNPDAEVHGHLAFLRRGMGLAIGLALACLLVSALLGRWDWSLGLLLGSGLSLLNFRLLSHSASRWLQQEERPRPSLLWKGFLFRLLFSGAAIALGLLYLPINIWGLAIGLFVAQGGLLLGFLFRREKLEEG